MNIDKMSATMERYVMPVAEKFGNERHLQAIRDAFMSLLPITFTGGIAAVFKFGSVGGDGRQRHHHGVGEVRGG